MPTSSKDRQPGGHRAADMEQREAIDHCIGLIKSVNLSKAPGGMNLISMRQADELWMAGCPSSMKQRANGVAIGVELKLKAVMLGRKRRIEVDHLSAGSLSPPITKTKRSDGTRLTTVLAFCQISGSSASDGITSTSAFSAISKSATASAVSR